MGNDRPEGLSAIGNRGQAAVSLMPDVDGTHVCILQSQQFECLYQGTYCTELADISVINKQLFPEKQVGIMFATIVFELLTNITGI